MKSEVPAWINSTSAWAENRSAIAVVEINWAPSFNKRNFVLTKSLFKNWTKKISKRTTHHIFACTLPLLINTSSVSSPLQEEKCEVDERTTAQKMLAASRMNKYLSDSFTYNLTCKTIKLKYFVQMRSLPSILCWSTVFFYKGFIIICPWKILCLRGSGGHAILLNNTWIVCWCIDLRCVPFVQPGN